MRIFIVRLKFKTDLILQVKNFLVHPVPWGVLVLLSFGTAVWLASQTGPLRMYAYLAITCSGFSLIIFSWAVGRRGAQMAVMRSQKHERASNEEIIRGFDQTLIGLALFDTKTFLWANTTFNKVFAIHKTPEDLGEVNLEFLQKSLNPINTDLLTLERLFTNASNGKNDIAELTVKEVNGSFARYQIVITQLAGGNTLWRVNDISSEYATQSETLEREAWFYDIVEFMPAGFLSVDSKGRILFSNDRLAEWLGMKKADLRGRFFSDFVIKADPVDDRDDSFSVGRITLSDGRGSTFDAALVQTAKDTLSPSGVTKPAYTRTLIIPGMLPSDLKKNQDLLSDETLEISDRVQWLFAEAPVGIALLDLEGQLVRCNSAFGDLFGMVEKEIIGTSFSKLAAPEDQSELKVGLSKVVMGVGRSVHLEINMPGIGSRELAVSLYASRTENADGEITGLVVHLVDVTEQKDLEIQFAQSQKMQAVGQLAGGVAHDFNNLLTAMIGFADLLLSRKGADDPDFGDLMQIKQNANRATNLVRQLLAFSRKQNLAPIEMDVTEALNDLSNLLKRLIGETVEIIIKHGDTLGPVLFDKGQFDQVIINLCVNARDAMPSGGSITISSIRETLSDPVQRGQDYLPSGNYIRIDVKDTGEGIPKENLARIFEPFFSTKEVGAGTGLGLSTVYGIIHQTGGFIFVDSAVGQGTLFSIYLPEQDLTDLNRPAIQEKVRARKAEPEGDLTGQGRIVLVEDEDAVRLFASRALRAKGYEILEANDGEMALEVIANTSAPIDLIVSDVVMPGMDGHTMVQLVRQEIPEIKVILMSGYSEDVFQGDFKNDPQIAFLGKPFTLKGLAGKVKEVLNEEF